MKARSIILRTAMISACLRESLGEGAPSYMVTKQDIIAGESIVSISLEIQTQIKDLLEPVTKTKALQDSNSNLQPTVEGLLQDKKLEKIIKAGAFKIKHCYEEAAKGEDIILVSKYLLRQLWPKIEGVDSPTFIKVTISLIFLGLYLIQVLIRH